MVIVVNLFMALLPTINELLYWQHKFYSTIKGMFITFALLEKKITYRTIRNYGDNYFSNFIYWFCTWSVLAILRWFLQCPCIISSIFEITMVNCNKMLNIFLNFRSIIYLNTFYLSDTIKFCNAVRIIFNIVFWDTVWHSH